MGTKTDTSDIVAPREADPSSIARYLLSFDWPMRHAAVEEGLVGGGLPLWLEILRLLPEADTRGRLLELGSPPFHLTLLTQKFRNYEVTPTAAASNDRPVYTQSMTSSEYREQCDFRCVCFDIERDVFPFPDAHFDVVMFCEVLEHLTENPVFALAEIHRVLKPGGLLILSTPNAARSGNIMRLWLGVNVFDQYHLGAPLRGTRHSREYTSRELTAIVSGCGFQVERQYGRNLGQIQFTRKTRPLEWVFRAFTLLAPGVHADHLFVRASKEGPFRWTFPAEIFDQGHLTWYTCARDSEVGMGINDLPHLRAGWTSVFLEGAVPCRRARPPAAEAVLCTAMPCHTLVVEATASRAEIVPVSIWLRDGDNESRIGTVNISVEAHSWSTATAALPAVLGPQQQVRIELELEREICVRRIALEP